MAPVWNQCIFGTREKVSFLRLVSRQKLRQESTRHKFRIGRNSPEEYFSFFSGAWWVGGPAQNEKQKPYSWFHRACPIIVGGRRERGATTRKINFRNTCEHLRVPPKSGGKGNGKYLCVDHQESLKTHYECRWSFPRYITHKKPIFPQTKAKINKKTIGLSQEKGGKMASKSTFIIVLLHKYQAQPNSRNRRETLWIKLLFGVVGFSLASHTVKNAKKSTRSHIKKEFEENDFFS